MTAQAAELRDRQVAALAALVQLERRVRAAKTLEELGFLMANDTHMIVGYRQAMLWRPDTRRLATVSGLAAPDPHAPFTVWLSRLAGRLAADEKGRRPHVVTAADCDPDDREFWAAHLPRHLLWMPLTRPDTNSDLPPAAILMLARDDPWSEPEVALLDHVVDAYEHAWQALAGPARTRTRRPPSRRQAAIGAALAALVLLLPVRQSALAPAEIVARNPTVVRAPLQGVIAEVVVQPNAPVAEGALLARLDPRELESRHEIARQAHAVSEAELRQMQQQAVVDDRSKAAVAVLVGRRDQLAAELAYLEELLGRTRLTAPRAGVAIFDDVGDLIGRPVALGEQIMLLADPADAELEIRLPVADAIALTPGAEVRFFLASDPASPLVATLTRTGYRAAAMPDGVMAYRLKARFAGTDARVRVGLKGTAKLYGERTSLALYLLRRPLAALRLHLGL